MTAMTREEHIRRHQELHKSLDELVADFITHTTGLPSQTSLLDFMQWSCTQCNDPTELNAEEDL